MRITISFALGCMLLWFTSCESETLKSPNGFEYINHTNLGEGKPEPGDYVYFHAQMRNGDSIMMSSRDQGQTPFVQIPPADAPQTQAPNPVMDVIGQLANGDSATIMIRIDTLPQKPPGFEDTDVLYYDVVVTDVVGQDAFMERQAAEQAEQQKAVAALQGRKEEVLTATNEVREAYNNGTLGDRLQETPSGLKYVVLEEGTGKKAEPGRPVDVHYYGMLADGTEFDNSFSRGQVFNFPLGAGQVIQGWDEGVALLSEGAKAVFMVPAELGYGERGAPPTIPPGAELVFYVELEQVK